MVLEDFYELVSTSQKKAGSLEITLKVRQDHEIFKGHFPEEAVTPAVALLQIVKNLLENHLQKKLQLFELQNAKFLSKVNPKILNRLIVLIYYCVEKKSVKIKSTVRFPTGVEVLKCNATFVIS